MYSKFPELYLEDLRLIWDWRQDYASVPEQKRRVYIKSYLDDQTKQKLRAIPASEYIEEGFPEFQLGLDASRACENPSQSLNVIAVTGTNGKSTTALLMVQLISMSTDDPVVVFGTLGMQIFKKGELLSSFDTGFTTPDAPSLQDALRTCLKMGVRFVVLEASSQGYALGRLSGLQISTLGFSNLTQDHLDFHGSMELYSEAKEKIFAENLNGVGVLHLGQEFWTKRFIDRVIAQNKGVNTLFCVNDQRDFNQTESALNGHSFVFEHQDYHFTLVGRHNLQNLRLAFEMYKAQFLSYPSPELVCKLKAAPGRLEIVENTKRPFVFVDYAHTPDALEKSLMSLSSVKPSASKLWVVFGCGGDRDTKKRPLMGAIAEKQADHVVLTSDNPRTENATQILDHIQSGMHHAPAYRHEDRKIAIEWALFNMKPQDILLIAGKGHEDYQIIGTKKLPFLDRDEVLKCLVRLKS